MSKIFTPKTCSSNDYLPSQLNKRFNKNGDKKHWITMIHKLLEGKKYWREISPSDIPKYSPNSDKYFGGFDTPKDVIDYFKKEFDTSLTRVKRHLGTKRFNEFASTDSGANRGALDWIGDNLFYIGAIIFILFIIFIVIDGNQTDCETITYQDFNANGKIIERRGQVCGDVKDKIHSRWKED